MHARLFLCLSMLLAGVAPAMSELKNRLVDYKQGDAELQGYMAWDDSFAGKRPAVLLIHRRDGMSDLTRANADAIAKLGYVVLAADIFGKNVRPKDTPEAQAQSEIYNKDRPLMRARALAGLETLQGDPMVDASKIALIGYCFGGTVAVELIETGAPIIGTVSVHGSFRDFPPGGANNIKGRMLILHGAEDNWIVLVVVMASVMVRLPVSVLMLTGPVALMFGGFTWANVKLPAFTKLRLPTFSAARVVTLLAAAVNETLPCMSARPVVVTTPLLF